MTDGVHMSQDPDEAAYLERREVERLDDAMTDRVRKLPPHDPSAHEVQPKWNREAVLDAEEREAMDHLLTFMRIVNQDWNLRVNGTELASAVHVLQGFVIQHMLGRIAPDEWGNWWEATRS